MKFTEFSDFTKKYPNERVHVFIDGANLYEAMKEEIPDSTIDYHKLGLKLVGERKIIRINYYVSELNPEWDDGAGNQQRFLAALKHLPFFTVRTRPLRYSTDKKKKWEKGIDILIATDMLSGAYLNGYDTVMLVSGDGDFAPVLDEIKKMGKRVENAFFLHGRADALVASCDVFVSLNKEMLKDCLRKKAASTTGGGKV
jgi:uncharacterized LabA/DUF88 family protein